MISVKISYDGLWKPGKLQRAFKATKKSIKPKRTSEF
jgi:hypothetical protein